MKNKLLQVSVILFLFLCNLGSHAQTKQEIDSLKKVLQSAIPDTNKVNVLNELSRRTHFLNYNLSLNYAKEALSLAVSLNFVRGKLIAFTNIGEAYGHLGKTTMAKTYLDRALMLAERLDDKEQKVILYNDYYLLYDNIDMKDKASDYAYKALKLSEEIGFDAGVAAMLINIASLCSNQGNDEKAKEMLYRSLEISKRINHKKKIAIINQNIGVILLEEGKTKEALNHFYKAQETYEKLTSYEKVINNNANIAISLAILGEFDEALRYYRRSYSLSLLLNDSVLLGKTLNELASFFTQTGNQDSGYYYIRKAYDLNKKTGNVSNLSRTYYIYQELKYNDNDYKAAYDFFKLYKKMEDSVQAINRKIKVDNLEAQYNLKKTERKLELLKIKDRVFRLKSIFLMILFLLISVIIFQRLNRRRIKNKKDKEIYALKLAQTEAKLKQKEAELKSFVFTIIEKNKLIRKLQNEIEEDKKLQNNNENILNLKKAKLRDLHILTEDDWLRFRSIFSEVYPQFLNKINAITPHLSEGDKRQLMLIKLGSSISLSADILGVGYKSVQKARQRLARKLNLKSSKEINRWVAQVEG